MKAYLSVGANIGEREKNIKEAITRLCDEAGRLVALSPLYETEPVGFETTDLFLNQAAIIETDLTPFELLDLIKEIERNMGRTRDEGRYVSRTIDLDIIFYECQIIDDERLIVPHPRMHERRFVLEPFCDIASDFIHPRFQMSVKELFNKSADNSKVKKLK